MSTTAPHYPPDRTTPGRFANASFAIMVGGWAAFAIALLVSQPTLDDIWTSVRDLPLILEGVVWLVGFPFLIGLAIWHSSCDEAVRLLAIAVLAVYTYVFVPRERKRNRVLETRVTAIASRASRRLPTCGRPAPPRSRA
jgi:hypothetical protein